MHCFLCLFHISLLDEVFSGCFRQCCVLTDLSIFQEDGKKFDLAESRIAFCQLFIVSVKKLYYEVKGKLLGCFFHYTQD